DDVACIHYNPAGLANLAFGYTYNDMDMDRRATSANRAHMLNLGPFGLISHQYEDIAGTNKADLLTLGYGARGGRGISWGFSLKEIRRSSAPPATWSSDMALLLQLDPYWKVGLNLRDFIKDANAGLPATARLGFAGTFLGGGLILSTDFEFVGSNSNRKVYGYVGFESGLMKDIKIRGGFNREWATLGASLSTPIGNLHYAAKMGPNREDMISMFSYELMVEQRSNRIASIAGPTEAVLIPVGGDIKGGLDQTSILGGYSKGVDSLIADIRRASKDQGIGVIFLRIGYLGDSLNKPALIQEMRSELLRAKDNGKKVVAFIEGSGLGDEYYLASVADKIVAPPQTWVVRMGKSISVMRVQELTDKLGIQYYTFTKGKYKDSFSQNKKGFTPEQRKAAAELIEDLFRQELTDISISRDIPLKELKKYADGLPMNAEDAKKLGFIDEIGYYDYAKDICGTVLGKDGAPNIISSRDLVSEFEYEGLIAPWIQKFAVIEIDGEIVMGSSGENLLFGGRWMGGDTIIEQIKNARDNPSIRAIILRINSPGGSTVASHQIYSALLEAKKKDKIIVASMGDMAASGGYYIAAAADKIVANPSTLTGSIGVIMELTVLQNLFKKIGIGIDTVKEGEHSDMFSGLRSLSQKEKDWLYKEMERSYDLFVKAVADGRKIELKKAYELADARVYTGNQAVKNSLVDELGNFDTAVDAAKELCKINKDVELIYYRRPLYWWESMNQGANSIFSNLFHGPQRNIEQYRLLGF
ncbi:MAG: signal peptide peptidase SppA, partial [bacterium]